MAQISNVLGLDIGNKRIGVARVNMIAKLPQPVTVLQNDSMFRNNLDNIISEYQIDLLVVGLPRSLAGIETDQSNSVRNFVESQLGGIKFTLQDETLSTVTAESAMKQYGCDNQPAMLDAVAACIILEDYLKT